MRSPTGSEQLDDVTALQDRVRQLDGEVRTQRQCIEDLERALRRSEAEREPLREAERQKDGFLSVAAHELRAPLTTIKAYVQLLLRRIGMPNSLASLDVDRTVTQLRTLERQANRPAHLIDELLDISRIQADKLYLGSPRYRSERADIPGRRADAAARGNATSRD